MTTLPSIEQALALVLARVRALPAEAVPIAAAAGRVTHAPSHAAVDLPPFASSAMDGYAVRADDTPGTLRLVGSSAAGSPSLEDVGGGEAVAISTGAVVPPGADAVVPVEQTAEGAGEVTVAAVAPGDNVRERGGDVRSGELVVPAGVVLGPAQIGALAAAGVATVTCAMRPRVAVLATGSELRLPGEPLAAGEIYESNSLLLEAECAAVGAVVTRHPAVGDDENATEQALAAALTAGVLGTSGGVSMGRHDVVRAALAALGAEEVFWRVAVRPGKPVAFAVRGETLIFSLPGNPVSSLVGFELFVRPALRALQGAEPGPLYLPGVLDGTLERPTGRDDLVRARRSVEPGGVHLRPLTGQGSHMIVHAAAADALVRVPRGVGLLGPGTPVMYLPI